MIIIPKHIFNMLFELDNQTLLCIIILLLFIYFFFIRIYVKDTIEINNKKILKKMTSRINQTFDKYMGNNDLRGIEEYKNIKNPVTVSNISENARQEQDILKQNIHDDVDSIEDPAEDDNEEE